MKIQRAIDNLSYMQMEMPIVIAAVRNWIGTKLKLSSKGVYQLSRVIQVGQYEL